MIPRFFSSRGSRGLQLHSKPDSAAESAGCVCKQNVVPRLGPTATVAVLRLFHSRITAVGQSCGRAPQFVSLAEPFTKNHSLHYRAVLR